MKKYKINLMENIPTDKEIANYMNFDKVVSKYKVVTLWKKLAIGAVSTGGTALIISAVLYFSGNNQKMQNSPEVYAETSKSASDILSTESTSRGLTGNNPILDSAGSGQPAEIQPLNADNRFEDSEKIKDNDIPKRVEVTEEGQSYNYIFKKANPLIGYDSLYKYLQGGMILPESSDNLKGKVVVAFSIDTLGRPVNIKIAEGLSDEINNEAIRLVESMPAWSPAELNGKPVETSLSIPIYIEIVKSGIQK